MNAIRRCLKAFCVLAVGLLIATVLQAEPLLKPGQRMVFLGDYITDQNMYTRYVANYFTLRYPGRAFSFRNLERRGDTVQAGNSRLVHDVLSLKPDVAVILCTNYDTKTVPFVSFWPFTAATLNPYIAELRTLVHELNTAGVRVVLLTPPCMEPNLNWRFKPDYNDAVVLKLVEAVKRIAADEKLPCVDVYQLMMDVMTKAKADNPKYVLIPWGNEPAHSAQAVITYALLKQMGCTDQPASLTLNARFGRVTADRCTVSNLSIAESKLSFTRTDDALPVIFDDEVRAISAYLPYNDDLNRYLFTVISLPAGEWKLTVQGIEVGRFSESELASGVNLSEKPGPWREMGKRVNAISKVQDELACNNWRIFTQQISSFEFPDRVKEASRLSIDSLLKGVESARIGATSKRTWDWVLEKL